MISSENIIIIVSEYFNTPIDKVLSTSRKAELVKTRQVSMYFMKLYVSGFTLEGAGKCFPGKTGYLDHATILFGIKAVNGYLGNNKVFQRDIGILNRKLVELFGLDTKIDQVESEEERFNRLWDEREKVLIGENKYLKGKNTSLENEISRLKGLVFALKENKKKPKKRVYSSNALVPTKENIIKLPLNENPYAKISPSNGREFSGFREHKL